MTTEMHAQRTRLFPIVQLTDSETSIDLVHLRAYRLARLRRSLANSGYAACLLTDPISIRYATGSRNASIFQMHVPCRYAFIPVEGPVVLFDGDYYRGAAEELETIGEFRPSRPLSFFAGGPRLDEQLAGWATEMAELFHRYAAKSERLAIDAFDLRAIHHLRSHGIALGDAAPAVELARAIKSPDEILCMSYAIAVAEVGMARMREVLRPGISENELWSILHQTNIAMGGEWIEGRLLAAGERANPWLQEASARMIRVGELVPFDTDMVGPFGYCADISRTFHCGPGKPTAAQRDLYKYAHEEVAHNVALLRPGMSFREFSERAWKPPERFVSNRYIVLAHGIGLCDEYPSIHHCVDWERSGYDGIIAENMTLCIESFIGVENGCEGVKLEEQVLVTAKGAEVLSRFPFEDALLA